MLATTLLTGCHADVTFRFDVRYRGTHVTTTAVIDDQLYRLAMSQNANADPFGMERLQRAGWTVDRAYDDNGNHTITISKLIAQKELNGAIFDNASLRREPLPFDSLTVSRSYGLFVEQDSLEAVTHPILPWAEAVLARPYAGLASALIGSAVAVHVELRTPGKVLATNGERTSHGFVRWDMNLQSPTKLSYVVRIVRFDQILLTSIVSLMTLALVFFTARRFYVARRMR